jgi:hypothetical protein
MSASGFEVNSGSLSLDSGCLGLRQGSRLCWCCQRRGYLVDKRRGQDHGQSDQQEDDRSKMRPQQARSNLGVRVPRCASLSTSLALLVHGIRPADAGSVAVTRHKVAAAPLGPISKKRAPNLRRFNDFVEWQGGDSNSQPTDYDAAHGWHDLLENWKNQYSSGIRRRFPTRAAPQYGYLSARVCTHSSTISLLGLQSAQTVAPSVCRSGR